MTPQSRWNWFFGISLLLLLSYISTLQLQVNHLKQRLILSRAVGIGRTQAEVERWMGPPSVVRKGSRVGGRQVATVLIYKSTTPWSGRLQGSEDVWVILNRSGRVETTYYPDFSADRANLETRVP